MNFEFWFKCPNCGAYRVSERTMMKFIPLTSCEEVKRKLEQGAAGVSLKFESKCPKCTPKGMSDFSINILWPKGHG